MAWPFMGPLPTLLLGVHKKVISTTEEVRWAESWGAETFKTCLIVLKVIEAFNASSDEHQRKTSLFQCSHNMWAIDDIHHDTDCLRYVGPSFQEEGLKLPASSQCLEYIFCFKNTFSKRIKTKNMSNLCKMNHASWYLIPEKHTCVYHHCQNAHLKIKTK